VNWRAFFVLLVVGLLYLFVIWLTYSWMIAAPRRWLLESQIHRLRVAVGVAEQIDQARHCAISAALTARLDELESKLKNRGNVVVRSFRAVNLNELMAIQQTLNGLSRQQAFLVPNDDLPSYAEPIFLRLGETEKVANEALRAAFNGPSTTPNARRILVARADELCHGQDDAALRAEYDRQRASLWLALVGLWGVIAIGSVLGHIETMLIGAIGGFLAPLIDARQSDAKQVTWGVRVLSPVGGALTAVAGLLMVSFLAAPDVDLLGGVFRNNSWNNPTTPVALALALLFGFSGKLFSSMAITAGSQIAGSSPPIAADAASPQAK
jgi:hypothetical protein